MLYDTIKKICKKRKTSISRLEKDANLSNGSISKWNNSSPTVENLQAVAQVLEVTVDELLKEGK